MTTGALRAGTAAREDSAEAAVCAFFAAYRAHDVEGMVDLCADNASFRYVPFEVWGRQRVLYGEGKVGTVGKLIWITLIDAFPDLTNAVTSLRADEYGNVGIAARAPTIPSSAPPTRTATTDTTAGTWTALPMIRGVSR